MSDHIIYTCHKFPAASVASAAVIGRIVGQSRQVAETSSLVYFGYLDGVTPDASTGGFGDLDDPTAGERYRSEDELITGDLVLADPEYRLFIQANRFRCR